MTDNEQKKSEKRIEMNTNLAILKCAEYEK